MSGGWDDGVLAQLADSPDYPLASDTLHGTLESALFYLGNDDDAWGPVTLGTYHAFESAGLPAQLGGVYADGGHEWSTWAWALEQAAPLLFRD